MNSFFSENLLVWYQKNKRDLPWRNTQNPYFIWLSEVILQQTRVAQGLPYYENFVKNFPTVSDMAKASETEILRFWQGLGYYSRARNMHQTAQKVAFELNGNFPNTFEELRKLKGVGDYTAAAIASFAFEEKVAVLDGNVFRVLARFFNIDQDISIPKTKKYFQALAQENLPDNFVSSYNQAIMEFGALHCTPQKPQCPTCVLRSNCGAFIHKTQDILPIKTKKTSTKERFFDYLVFSYQNQFLMKVRSEGDIWQGLYDFFLVEDKNCPTEISEIYEACLRDDIFFSEIHINSDIVLKQISPTHKHILTHQKIFAKFYFLEINNEKLFEKLKNLYLLKSFDYSQILALPKPILIANYIEKMFG